MTMELRLHGHIDESIEYYATAASRQAELHHFYQADDNRLRFFAPGNEFLLSEKGIDHRGNGGSFCEYMFGVDQPHSDLAKAEIRNRLVLFGTSYNENGQLFFSKKTDGRQNFEQIFFEGNAVRNNFFFLSGEINGALEQQQEQCLRLLGKELKRTSRINDADDACLVEELLEQLPGNCTLFMFRLIHKPHRRYQDMFAELYYQHRSIPDDKFAELQQLASDLNIDQYQQERIRIDVMYRHPDNNPIVNEYKKVLIDCHRQGYADKEQKTRLTRLKTLSVRNKIPSALFYTLDDMLKIDQQEVQPDSDYLARARQILQTLLDGELQNETGVAAEEMIQLLRAKQQANLNRDHSFEELLLDTGKTCDEKIRDGADLSLLENFSYIITFFDRYDSASTQVGQLAFMENFQLSEELVRSLLGNRNVFDELQPGFFDEIFFRDILQNNYLGRFGRRKVNCLRNGLRQISDGDLKVAELVDQLAEVSQVEQLYLVVFNQAKDRIRNFYSGYNTKEEQSKLLEEVNSELLGKGAISSDIPRHLFHDVILNIKKEAVYMHNLLPKIIFTQDRTLREDFLSNSGLDRFYVEELEREYFTLNKLDPNDLTQLRSEPNN
ncbi:MAG: TIGR04442 family protein [Desulfuromonas sp.]|nr:MAG: TIGR04442 family protein [Desulfuromonas sp.]